MKPTFVLDCSVTMAWCFEDESNNYTEKVLEAVSQSTALIPILWSVEVANCLFVAERKKRISHTKALAFRECLRDLFIVIDEYLIKQPVEIILDLARESGLTAYDAVYLELAIRKNLPLATLNKDLKQATKKMGIEIYLN